MIDLLQYCKSVSDIEFNQADVFRRLNVNDMDLVLLSGSLVEGSGTPTSDFDFCIISPYKDDRFFIEKNRPNNSLRFYTSGSRIKASFDYLEDCRLGVDVEYRTVSEIEEMVSRLEALYIYLKQRARKFSSFSNTGIDFRFLARVKYAVLVSGEDDQLKRLASKIDEEQLGYCLYRTAVGSFPDFRDISGMAQKTSKLEALLQMRKLCSDTFRGLTHLCGNLNPNPKYLNFYAEKCLADTDYSILRDRYFSLMTGDLTVSKGDYEAALQLWLAFLEDVFSAIRDLRSGNTAFPSMSEFESTLKAECNPDAQWHNELCFEYLFRLKEVRCDLPSLIDLFKFDVNSIPSELLSEVKSWFSPNSTYVHGENGNPYVPKSGNQCVV